MGSGQVLVSACRRVGVSASVAVAVTGIVRHGVRPGGLKKFGPAIALRLQAISYAFFDPQSAIRNS